MRNPKFLSVIALLVFVGAIIPDRAVGQSPATVFNFESGNYGYEPGAVVLAKNGDLVALTTFGGTEGGGTVVKITPSGQAVTQYNFGGEDEPQGLMLGQDGNLYGTTYTGGAQGNGQIFEITGRKLKTIYSFCSQTNCTDGSEPESGVVRTKDGTLYGVTSAGGTHTCVTGLDCKVVYSLGPNGVLTTLYDFCSQANCTDGALSMGLTLGRDGNLYGTTAYGGTTNCPPYGCGTIFRSRRKVCLQRCTRFAARTNARMAQSQGRL